MLAKCHLISDREWLKYVESLQGSIVTYPGKRPASIRLDQLDRDQIMSSMRKNSSNTNISSGGNKNTAHPLIIHFSMFRNTWLPMIKNNMQLKKLYHKYFKLRHLLNNKAKPTSEDKAKLRDLHDELQSMIKKTSDVMQKEIMVEISSKNFCRTGIRTDVVQQSVLIPTFIEHLRFHLSLKYLEEKINYRFKNRLLLQYALTHPSGAFLLHQNLGSNPDHIRNALFNCKVRNPSYGILTPQKRKSLLRKKGIHMLFSIMSQKANDYEQSSCISNYERLEFLGDKILELLTSRHLFFLFSTFDEGKLSEYRNAIVQNQYLAILARKLDLHYFIIFYHGVDLCSNSALNHALANSFEALLAAIYLDSDMQTVSNVLSKALWYEENSVDLHKIWVDLPPHPIQAQLPVGDRHLIANTKILQHIKVFEDMIGVEFKHIRLLAQAFCTRSASFNLITLGDNQRLEFLGILLTLSYYI
jgi:ribonuclease III